MNLSKKERLSYIYQLRILEALYPGEADGYAKHRKALEEGYSLHYGWMFEGLYEDLSEASCREVLDILDMYRAIYFGLEKIDPNDALHKHHLSSFIGFDGNNETHLMSYVRYFIEDLERFSELRQEGYSSFNSHCSMLNTYREMLHRWHAIGERFKLSREQIASVLGAD